MPAPLILTTKLYIPPHRSGLVQRLRLADRLNESLAAGRKLTLISASAGFGKTTLASEWLAASGQAVAWLSLEAGDGEPARFLSYFVAALQGIAPKIGEGILAALQSPRPPSSEALLLALLNEIAAIPKRFILVLDDYHALDSSSVDQALAFILEHQPPQMHLVIATREDPSLPLARLRARNQLTELRTADLRFTPVEAAEFLNRVMGLNLSAGDVAALEARTEGWVAGLQLAALSMQGGQDSASFIQSFTGSHRFVLDYLMEEVLHRQPETIQAFLLRTSILDRMCGPLCDAVLGKPSQPATFTLETIERANLFLVPLDSERRWYRYHHLFGELLRKRLGQTLQPGEITGLHLRASEWYENNGLAFEAFHHATMTNDVARAERLIGSQGMELHFRSVSIAVLDWLASLPKTVLDARPRLWVRSATLSLIAGRTTGVEENIQAAEKALENAERDEKIRDLFGQMACARATLALTHYDSESMIIQARLALESLHPDNLVFRFTANWVLATALIFQGNRRAAFDACLESLAISEKSGDTFSRILATSTLGLVQELGNQLSLAAETYRSTLALFGEYPQPNAEEAYLGLARIHYQWNDLDAAEMYGQRALHMAQQYDRVIDRFIISEVFLARLKLARGDVDGAARDLMQVEQTARQKRFVLRLPEIADAQVLVLLEQGNLPAAAQLAQQFELPLGQARVLLAQGEPSATLASLAQFRQQMEDRGWVDERLRALVLQAVAFHLGGEQFQARQTLAEALALAEPGGFIRLFVDEGEPMRSLILDFRSSLGKPANSQAQKLVGYTEKLLGAFPLPVSISQSEIQDRKPEVDFLSPRELEILRLIAQGLSNQEICERLFLALDTVKGHNRRIFDKLQAQRRTEAIARARELGLL